MQHRKRLRVPISEQYCTPQTTQASFVSSIGNCMARWYKEWRAMPQVIMLHLQQFRSEYYCRHICKFPHKMWNQRLPAVSTAYSTCNFPTGASAGSNKLLDVRIYRWPSCAAPYITRQPRPLLGICKAWELSLALLALLCITESCEWQGPVWLCVKVVWVVIFPIVWKLYRSRRYLNQGMNSSRPGFRFLIAFFQLSIIICSLAARVTNLVLSLE